ncbi:hypothetical protein VHUM_03720 [Vanrija humicola]|uniref:Serine/threonine-protein kinase RIO2 n=1 Tax=Vanrija humicola TaxID=5417 RepID=A0A7D8UZH7_VANHU|nr:hypothetical protein VHUM_03720 [Vanrija humicola]
MRLDATDLRYITADEFRVLTATEIGSKNHEVVPSHLIAQLSGLTGGNVNKLCGQLAKRNLIARVVNARYDGYRLTYGGLDYLSLRTFTRRKPASVASVGKKIGVGKESDIYLVRDDAEEKRVLKLHRLGRISFRAIKSKRDYLGKRSSASWMYMSRLSAQKEFTYMKILYDHGFPVPTPIDQSRHCVVMSLIDADPMRAVMQVDDVAELYGQLMELIMRFARSGLIHGDFNEFNILVPRKGKGNGGDPIVIDFPQMVSTRHENAEFFFNRDVNCIRRFFRKRFRFEGATWPVWKDVLAEEEAYEAQERRLKEKAKRAEVKAEGEAEEEQAATKNTEPEAEVVAGAEEAAEDEEPELRVRLDLLVEASGFGRQMQRELEDYMLEIGDMPNPEVEDDDEEDSEDDDDDEEEEEDDEETEATADPEAEASSAAAKLEALRIHRALGNDGNPEDELPEEAYTESEEESDSESDSGHSGVAQSDYTQYVRAPRAPRARPNVSKLGAVDELREIVAKDIEQQQRGKSSHHARKGLRKVGNAKGHKWKSSASYLTGQNSAW